MYQFSVIVKNNILMEQILNEKVRSLKLSLVIKEKNSLTIEKNLLK